MPKIGSQFSEQKVSKPHESSDQLHISSSSDSLILPVSELDEELPSTFEPNLGQNPQICRSRYRRRRNNRSRRHFRRRRCGRRRCSCRSNSKPPSCLVSVPVMGPTSKDPRDFADPNATLPFNDFTEFPTLPYDSTGHGSPDQTELVTSSPSPTEIPLSDEPTPSAVNPGVIIKLG